MPELSLALSPTQISTWLECRRKWGWKYVAKIPAPQNASAALGSNVHGHLERYLADGTPIPFHRADGTRDEAGEIAASGVHLLPPAGSCGMGGQGIVERPFKRRLPLAPVEGPAGRLSEVLMGGRVDLTRTPPGMVEIWDHKTTSNISAWAKSSEDLRTDPQAIIYGWDGLETYGGKTVKLRWVYYQTKGARKAEAREAQMSRDEISGAFEKILVVSSDIANTLVATERDGDRGPLSLEPNPGACEAYGGCPYRHLCNLSPQQRMKSIMSNGSSLLATLRNQSAAVPVTVTRVGLADPTASAPSLPVQMQTNMFAVNPPEGSTPAAAPVSENTATEEAPKAKRGKKAAKAEEAPACAPTGGGKRAFTLYIDAVPIGRAAKTLEDWIQRAKELACEEAKVGDYRYVEFGKGAGMVSEAFFALFDQNLLDPDGFDAFVLSTATSESAFLISGLVARAALTVRGTR